MMSITWLNCYTLKLMEWELECIKTTGKHGRQKTHWSCSSLISEKPSKNATYPHEPPQKTVYSTENSLLSLVD